MMQYARVHEFLWKQQHMKCLEHDFFGFNAMGSCDCIEHDRLQRSQSN